MPQKANGDTVSLTRKDRARPGCRAEQARRNNEALIHLVADEALASSDLGRALNTITESATHTLGVSQAGIWMFSEDRAALRCLDLFLADEKRLSRADDISAATFPAYFAALRKGDPIDAHDAHRDPRTRELSEPYLSRHGISAMLDAPIFLGGKLVGVVCCEHTEAERYWSPEDIQFASSIAVLTAQVVESHERADAMSVLPEAKAQPAAKGGLVQIAACNPCNPCAGKNPCNPCNPCAGKNPCAPCNPCNPCAGK